MKKTKTQGYLHDYYCSMHVKASPARVILSKSDQAEQKAQKSKKVMYALGSN
ncbi:hypothetical protein VU12_03255 [Desulfobulbus sp. US4]|nr:hypothetical protein [Desulfobulbus sp. US4]